MSRKFNYLILLTFIMLTSCWYLGHNENNISYYQKKATLAIVTDKTIVSIRTKSGYNNIPILTVRLKSQQLIGIEVPILKYPQYKVGEQIEVFINKEATGEKYEFTIYEYLSICVLLICICFISRKIYLIITYSLDNL